MTTDEKIQRHKVLRQLEQELKDRRDFEGLLKIHDESMELFGSVGNHSERIPQKAYCLARLGRKEEAENALKGMQMYSLFMDRDELFRIVTLISFFLQSKPEDFELMQLNTLRNWLKDPEASKQVLQIVFDYKDMVGDVKPFDSKRLECRQTKFSQKLIECVFASMGRDDETKIYYNKETNGVQQAVEGYLSDCLAEDQSTENRRLYNRITNSESTDPIIKGIHYLIPRLELVEFLNQFRESATEYEGLQDFVTEFEEYIIEEFKSYVDDIEELSFGHSVREKFFNKLDDWFKENDFDIDDVKSVINQTMKAITLNFLREVNEIDEDEETTDEWELNLGDIYFVSSDHLRYENGVHISGPHGGARRAVKVENNIEGKEGFTVTLFNLDGNHPTWGNNIQMAPKQMKVVSSSKEKTVLRGWGEDWKAFGDPAGSFANYGISIFHPNNEIEKIIMNMHDRSVDIEYLP